MSAEQELAAKFSPVLNLVVQAGPCGPGEPYQPSDVDPLFDNNGVALRGPWGDEDLVAVGPSVDQLSTGLRGYALDLPGDQLQPGCDYEKWAQTVWGPDAEPTIYARVATQSNYDHRIALQYFFYYPFNDFNNKHESDWERIQLEFAADDATEALHQTPVRVVYAQHYGSESTAWDDDELQLVDETHPVVYVAAGSHASQYGAGLYLGNSASTGFGCDTTVGPHEQVEPVVLTIPSDPREAARTFPWTTYEGHWGERGPRNFYTGPTGPNMKLAWNKPFTWSEGARPTRYPVPGASALGRTGTDFFCSAVGKGSDILRQWLDRPGPVLGVLLAGLIVLLWALRRTSWNAEPFPVNRRRRAGEIIAAAAQVGRNHGRLFARLTIAPLTFLMLAVVLQALSASHNVPLLWRLLVAVGALASLVLFTGAVVQTLTSVDSGRPLSATGAYSADLRSHLRALTTVALAAVVLLLLSGTLILLPVALLLLVGMSILVPVVHLEGRWGPAALWQSMRLTWRGLGTVVPLFVLCLLVSSFLGLLLAAGLFILFSAPFIVVNAVPPLVTALVWPFVSLLVTYAYFDAAARDPRPTDAAFEPPASP